MEFVQNFTPPDFQAKNFTPSISPNFNSFSKKKHKKLVKMEKFTPLAKILHCRQPCRHWQIPPLSDDSSHGHCPKVCALFVNPSLIVQLFNFCWPEEKVRGRTVKIVLSIYSAGNKPSKAVPLPLPPIKVFLVYHTWCQPLHALWCLPWRRNISSGLSEVDNMFRSCKLTLIKGNDIFQN